MALVVMDALSHQAIRASGEEQRYYRAPPDKAGRWRGKRLTGVESCLAELGHTFAIKPPERATLADAGVLIVGSRSQSVPFETAELTAIRRFVLDGGGLLLMANHRHFIAPQQQVAVAMNLPFAFNEVTIGGFPEIELGNHPVATGCDQIHVRNTTSLVASPSADAIARFTVDPRHLFAVACTAGAGRIIATGDSGFIASSDDTERAMFDFGSNARFFANVVRWLNGSQGEHLPPGQTQA